MEPETDLLNDAERIADLANHLGIDLLVIGAMALAAHHYVRATEDIDLAGVVNLDALRKLKETLEKEGYMVTLREPDGQDPLGGVLDIEHSSGMIQIVSFAERFPAVIRDAFHSSGLFLKEKSTLKVSPLPHLVALKLYAGGYKSKSDIFEVLSRNPDADLEEIDALCRKYRIGGFKEIRRELEG
jgi:predicted nucleotidyltransferase